MKLKMNLANAEAIALIALLLLVPFLGGEAAEAARGSGRDIPPIENSKQD
jgi:hypothetical protein